MKKSIVFILLLLCTSFCSFAQKQTSRVDKNLTIYNDVLRQLDISYADTLNYDDLVATSIHQMLRKIDPYTVYIPEDKTNDLKLMTTGKYGGIGAMIMQRQDTFPETLKKYRPKSATNRYVSISEPYAGMPAAKNDVRAGDIIIEVDGNNVLGKTTSEVSALLRGTPHSIVSLRLLRPTEDKPLNISFEREEIKLPPVEYTAVLTQAEGLAAGDAPTGYILFSEFTEGSANIFRQAVDDLIKEGNITRLVIDLRDNGGGIIDEAVQIMSLFVPKGTEIVSTKGKNEKTNRVYKTTTHPRYPDIKLAVLVNHNSASAAEIVAGALQDLDRAVIVGTRTYGKGLVQSIRPIAYNGHLKVTTSKYYIPSGRCIQAIDYSKRRADGSVERVPDSLTHEFKTAKGRIVRDGGGIEPDVLCDDSSKVDVTYSLYLNNFFFDYANLYRNTHATLRDSTNYTMTDEELQQFISYLHERHFTYQTETSKFFDDMLDMAHHEDIDSTTIAQLEEFKDKLTPSFENAINEHAEEVKNILEREITQRYFYQKGAIAQALKNDKILKKAVDELND